jgi:tetratricopeptide (TPR) repeat protein
MLDQVEDKLPQITEVYATYARTWPNLYLANFLYAKALAASAADPQQTEALLRKSIKLFDRFWESHYELALLLERRHDFEAAAGEYRRALETNSVNPALHYHLARVYERLGKKTEAAAEYAEHERQMELESIMVRQSAPSHLDLPSK